MDEEASGQAPTGPPPGLPGVSQQKPQCQSTSAQLETSFENSMVELPEFTDAVAEFTANLAMKRKLTYLSYLLGKYKKISPALIIIMQAMIDQKLKKKNLPKDEKNFIADFYACQDKLRQCLEEDSSQEGNRQDAGEDSDIQPPGKNLNEDVDSYGYVGMTNRPLPELPNPIRSVPTIKMYEMILKPLNFNGTRPPPRKWLDDYEHAAAANGWNTSQMAGEEQRQTDARSV